jgi:hypothetical protein
VAVAEARAPVQLYPIEVFLGAIKGPGERRYFNEIGTNYSLKPEQIQRLIDLGPRLLGESSVFRKLVDSLK